MMRIGHGYDVHAFGDGDYVVLGGVQIPCERGLIAHSDGDVPLHALCDALLGAAGLGDIGTHFPDTDPAFSGADSRVLLRAVVAQLNDADIVRRLYFLPRRTCGFRVSTVRYRFFFFLQDS